MRRGLSLSAASVPRGSLPTLAGVSCACLVRVCDRVAQFILFARLRLHAFPLRCHNMKVVSDACLGPLPRLIAFLISTSRSCCFKTGVLSWRTVGPSTSRAISHTPGVGEQRGGEPDPVVLRGDSEERELQRRRRAVATGPPWQSVV